MYMMDSLQVLIVIICDAANKMGYGDIVTVDEAIDMIKGK